MAAPLFYPFPWQTRRVRSNGWIQFHGILRFIGRAFVRQLVGLQCAPDQTWNVRMGTLLIGIRHQSGGNHSKRYTMFCTLPNRRIDDRPQALTLVQRWPPSA